MKKANLISALLTGNFLIGTRLLISLLLLCSNESQVLASTDWTQLCSTCSCTWSDTKKKADCGNKNTNSISNFSNISDEVEIISFANNDIYSLNDEEFKNINLLNLQQIFLQNNNITRIEQRAFEGLRNLNKLDLSQNRLPHVDPILFAPLVNLKELVLSHNPVKYVSVKFPFFRFLQRLDLSFCNLTQLPEGVFDNLEGLTHLNLLQNRFHHLSAAVFKPVSNFKELTLASNPWDCDCHLRELFIWVTGKKQALSTTCQYSDGRNTTKWEVMKDADFYCKPVITAFQVHLDTEIHQGPTLSVEQGNDITIECQIEADPNPVISWLRNNKPLVISDKYLVKGYGSSPIWSNLTIKQISGDDAGTFTCRGVQTSGIHENNIDRSVEVAVPGASVGVGAAVHPRRSKTWIWILLSILGALLLVAIMFLLIFYCLKRLRQRRKTHDKRDFNGVEKKQPMHDELDAGTAPLIEKPPPVIVETMVPLRKDPEPVESNYAEVRAMTPMPQMNFVPSHYGYNNPNGLTKTYLSNSQVYLPRELHYHPGGYATYDPRRAPNNQVELFKQPATPYGRLYSPFSGSVASFASEPPVRVPHGLGYVTLPRRRRVPSWSPAPGGTYPQTHVPLSPTGSLPPVPNLRTRYQPMGPRYDTVGPRTTADGGSNLSLNKVGLAQTPSTPMSRTPAGYLTPSTPSTPSTMSLQRPHRNFTPLTPNSGRIPKTNTSLQNYKGIPGTHFNFDPIEENDGPVTPTKTDVPLRFPTPSQNASFNNHTLDQSQSQPKIPPVPPAKPKRKSQNMEDQNVHVQDISTIQGTEV